SAHRDSTSPPARLRIARLSPSLARVMVSHAIWLDVHLLRSLVGEVEGCLCKNARAIGGVSRINTLRFIGADAVLACNKKHRRWADIMQITGVMARGRLQPRVRYAETRRGGEHRREAPCRSPCTCRERPRTGRGSYSRGSR